MTRLDSPLETARPRLSTFVRQHLLPITAKMEGLAQLVDDIAAACISISREVARASVDGTDAAVGEVNRSGDTVRELDRIAHEILGRGLADSGMCAGWVSEEEEAPIAFAGSKAAHLVAADPLDGSSNIGLGIPVGTIFSIYHRSDREKPLADGDFLQPGRNITVAGYVLYGTSTELVITAGEGVHGFVLEDGVFRLLHHDLRVPESCALYSVNEGNAGRWSPGLRRFVEGLKRSGASQRYVGSMVADVHRTLLRGGVFLYPGCSKSPAGKLRYLYEGAPMAKLFECAGGLGTNGSERLLDHRPSAIHERTPVALGNRGALLELKRTLDEESEGMLSERVPSLEVPHAIPAPQVSGDWSADTGAGRRGMLKTGPGSRRSVPGARGAEFPRGNRQREATSSVQVAFEHGGQQFTGRLRRRKDGAYEFIRRRS